VYWAVHFDDEASGGAVEINDEAENDVLATKVQVIHAMLAKMFPEDDSSGVMRWRNSRARSRLILLPTLRRLMPC